MSKHSLIIILYSSEKGRTTVRITVPEEDYFDRTSIDPLLLSQRRQGVVHCDRKVGEPPFRTLEETRRSQGTEDSFRVVGVLDVCEGSVVVDTHYTLYFLTLH